VSNFFFEGALNLHNQRRFLFVFSLKNCNVCGAVVGVPLKMEDLLRLSVDFLLEESDVLGALVSVPLKMEDLTGFLLIVGLEDRDVSSPFFSISPDAEKSRGDRCRIAAQIG
jgi:hypothetical protein